MASEARPTSSRARFLAETRRIPDTTHPFPASVKKSIWIFVAAILLPSIVLGWLALRTAEEQQIILERRTAQLFQTEADNLADAARVLIDEQRRTFNDTVRTLLAEESPKQLSERFATALAKAWTREAVGFAVTLDGKILSPTPKTAAGKPAWEEFLSVNDGFLSANVAAPVYRVAVDELNYTQAIRRTKLAEQSAAAPAPDVVTLPMQSAVSEPIAELATSGKSEPAGGGAPGADTLAGLAKEREVVKRMEKVTAQAGARGDELGQAKKQETPAKSIPPKDDRAASQTARSSEPQPAPMPAAAPQPLEKKAARKAPAASPTGNVAVNEGASEFKDDRDASLVRNVAPQQQVFEAPGNPVSQMVPATADFQALIAENTEGVLARFVQDKLDIIFWLRSPQDPQLIFGCLIKAANLRDLWPIALPPSSAYRSSFSTAPEFVLALLDDKGRPVATQPAGVTDRDWKRPFVATEIGEVLPHWEAALYLMRPQQLQESARTLRRSILILVSLALAAIASGGYLVVADARRQLALAQKKTDFVSNVSHELKTPLTSIRMFAELMQNGRPETNAKFPQYLRIIMVEAERLTRLINNVLDFAKIERHQKVLDRKPLDLHAVIARTWEGIELHLREAGFTTKWVAAPPPYPVLGDDDALAQILVNLLSNAEKYSNNSAREVELHSYLDAGHVCVAVLDRGSGVPAGEERKIFEAFYRAHDSLSSGIQGSGLGLTLAQRLAREQGGEIVHAARIGGGSSFTLRIPIARDPEHPA